MSDEQLTALFLERNTNAISAVLEQYGAYCTAIAENILRSPEDTEECVNDAMIKAWQTIPPEHPISLKAYLGTITRNLAVDRFRKRSAGCRGKGDCSLPIDELSELLPSGFDLENEADAILLREKLNAFVSELDGESRILFIRRYWYMLSIEELAEMHGISKSKVKMRLLRTRSKLREHLKKEGYEL